MLEYCYRCLSDAPGADAWESADWLVLLTREGEYIGIVCSGCIADEDLAIVELEELYEIAA
jgi:hypothetical protein